MVPPDLLLKRVLTNPEGYNVPSLRRAYWRQAAAFGLDLEGFFIRRERTGLSPSPALWTVLLGITLLPHRFDCVKLVWIVQHAEALVKGADSKRRGEGGLCRDALMKAWWLFFFCLGNTVKTQLTRLTALEFSVMLSHRQSKGAVPR